jgi:hypothetical protein
VSLIRKPQVHNPLLVTREDRAIGLDVVGLRLLRRRCQSIKNLFRAPRNKLGIPKPLVVTAVAQELRRVLEEVLQVGRGDACFLAKCLKVPRARAEQAEDKIVDRFGFGRYLAQCYAGACEGGSVSLSLSKIMSLHHLTTVYCTVQYRARRKC